MQEKLIVYNQTRDVTLGDRVSVADGFWTRLKGLLGRRELESGEGLLLIPCASVHTMGMKFSIDVVFVSVAGRVLRVVPRLAPGKIGASVRGARYVLELPAGGAVGVEPGDQIVWRICEQN
ncbi:MAG: DUF192 domain-containing protein [Firmicutes bacterium]|nr:DUF192 domain-containing protein [Bacillota bacterium]